MYSPAEKQMGAGRERELSAGGRVVAALFGDRYVPSPIKLIVAVGVLCALTFVLLSENPWSIFKFIPYRLRPETDLPDRIPDKVYHFTGYFTLALVFMWFAATRAKWLVLVLVPLMVAHAIGTEILQGYVPDRTTDWTDFVANSLGISLGTAIGLFCRRFVNREDPELVLWAGANPVIPVAPIPATSERSVQGRGAQVPVAQKAVRQMPMAASASAAGNNDSGSLGFNRNELDDAALAELHTRVVNYRFLGICCATAGILLGSAYYVHGWQVRRNAGQLLQLGQEAREAGELAKARDFYARYISLVPTNRSVMADYGVLIDETRKGSRGAGHVFNIFEDVLRLDPSREDIRRRQVKLAFDMGRYTDAFDHLKVLRQAHPSEGELDVKAAQCQEQLGEYKAAAETYRMAIEHSPELVDAYRQLALLLYQRLDERDAASKLLDELVSKNETDARSWIARSEFRREVGSYTGAADDMRQAIELAPQDLKVLSSAGDLGYARAMAARGEGRQAEVERVVTETLTTLNVGLEHHPRELELLLRQVLLQSHFGDASAAFESLTEIAAEHPKDPRVQMMLADVSIERGDFAKAKASIEKLPRTPQADALRLFLRGRIEIAEKEIEKALATLSEARRFMADSPTLLERADLAIALCYQSLGQVEGELDAFRRIVKENPTSLVGRLGLANSFAKSGRLSDAIAEYGQLKHMPQVRLMLARVLILKNLKLAEIDRDWGDVEVLLDDARKHGDHPAHETLLRVEMLAGKGLYEDARQLLENARSAQVDRAEYLMALHQIADRSGDARQAALYLGQALEAAGDVARAEEELKKAVELSSSTDPAARQQLMQFYLRQQRPNDAMQVFKAVAQGLNRRELAKSYAAFGDLGRAVTLLQQDLNERPDAVSTLQALADIYLGNGLEGRAEPLLRKIIAQSASIPESTVKRARRQLSVLLAKRPDEVSQNEARALLTANVGGAQASPEDQRAQAAMLAQSRLIDDRREALRLLLQLDDRELLLPSDRWLLARLYEGEGDAAQASRHLEKLLAVGTNHAAYLRDYVRYQIEHGGLAAAAKWLKRLEELAPQETATGVLAARLQAAQGEHDAAQSGLRALAASAAGKSRAARLTDLVQASDEIAKSLKESKTKAEYARLSEEFHQAAMSTEPQHVQVYVEWLAQSGRTSEAFAQLDAVWQKLPAESAAGVTLSLLGSADDPTAHAEDVEKRLKAALEKSPKSSLLKVCLADLRSLQGQADAAESLYREALENDRKNVLALNNLAWHLAVRGKLTDEAMMFVERAIAIAGAAPQLLDTRATVWLAQSNPSRAIKDLKRVLLEEPTPGAHFRMALALAETGELEAARTSFKAATARGFKAQHPVEREQLAALQQRLK